MNTYAVVVERDSDTSLLGGYVPGFPGAHSQAETLDELHSNMREVIEMLLEDGEPVLEGRVRRDAARLRRRVVVGNVPVLSPQEVVRLLLALGFEEVR